MSCLLLTPLVPPVVWATSSGQRIPRRRRLLHRRSSPQNHTRWQDLMVGKLSDRVALVGPTISCEGSPYQGNVQGEWRANPHVQVWSGMQGSTTSRY